ncbi:hypothetical protein BD289DRAFT_454777 [Coniella lustricola]|uniref:Xylanolytic transcriptional activator regulatory domain-containing protein n=1 Tax=Coniella lustricola TaxID=2025994 RepID=A0A2T3A2C9_9PEZI|nr:hypothetical protein BD289DRAFT_454777 [Coniella lustricola]
MSDIREKYAIGCTRQSAGCQRCRGEGIACNYSRTGVIRRNRKRKGDPVCTEPAHQAQPHSEASESVRPCSGRAGRSAADGAEAQANAGASTHDRLQMLVGKRHSSLKELAVLLEEFSNTWNGAAACHGLCKDAASDYYLFDEPRTLDWINALNSSLHQENLMFDSVPPEVVGQLLASRPRDVPDRAWLIMLYSIALNLISTSSSVPSDTYLDKDLTQAQLTSNLWLAFNDARLLLEPSATTVQALFIMACYAEAIATPALTWSLVHQAGAMLSALGIQPWRLDPVAKQRRARMFWRLNVLDKTMALMLFRPPMFSREMVDDVPMPTLHQLVPPAMASSKSHAGTAATSALGADAGVSTPTVFTAHFYNQMHLLCGIMDRMWCCLHTRDAESVPGLKTALESWHRGAVQVLEAAALVEKPLLAGKEAASIDIGLQTVQYRYEYLSNLVGIFNRVDRQRSSSIPHQPPQHTYPQKLVGSLPGLRATLTDHARLKPFGCMLWVYAGNVMTAFRVLWVGAMSTSSDANARVAAHATTTSAQSLEMLDQVVELFDEFRERNVLLTDMASSMSRIARLVRRMVTEKVQPAKTEDESWIGATTLTTAAKGSAQHAQPMDRDLTTANTTASPAFLADLQAGTGDFDMQGDGVFSWDEDLTNGSFDWLTWVMQESSMPVGGQ